MKKTIKKVMALTMITFSLLFAGCQKDLYDPDSAASSKAPITGIPANFDWSTVSSVNLTVNVDDQYNGEYFYTVEVFDQNPIINTNATLLGKGVAKKGQAFITELSVPKTVSSIAIRQTNPRGISVVRTVNVASSIVCSFESTTTVATKRSASYVTTKSVTVTESDFATSAPAGSVVYTGSLTGATNYTITDGFNGGINLYNPNLSLYVSGKVHLSSLYLASGCKLYLLPGAEVISDNSTNLGQSGVVISINTGAKYTTSSMTPSSNVKVLNRGNLNATTLQITGSSQLYNEGTITVSGKLSGENQESYIENKGTITAQDFELAGNSSMTNAGDVTIANKTYISSTNAVWRNENGTFTTKEMEIAGGNQNSYNGCKLVITDLFNLHDAKLINDAGAYISCNTLTMNNAKVELGNNAIFNVAEQATYQYNPQSGSFGFYGTGTQQALLKIKKAVANSSTQGNIINYSGKLQIECQDHPSIDIDAYNKRYTIDSSVEWVGTGETSISIPKSECSEGNNAATGGTPSNPTFPIEVPTNSYYTYAMEDLWPAYGDYDMNDLVTTISTSYAANSANKVETMTIDADLRAVGATKSLGAAFQLDKVTAGNVSSVTYSTVSTDGSVFVVSGTKVESGQTLAVIPLFDNAHKFIVSSGITNTVVGGQTVPSKSVKVTITFKEGTVTPSDISVKNLNFFIVNDGLKTNRTEIHLAGYNATDKVNTSLFGTGVDNSNGSTKYLSKDNLVWGMMIPIIFEYPTESTDIRKAYPNFETWAQSGGTSNSDWYNSPTTGAVYNK